MGPIDFMNVPTGWRNFIDASLMKLQEPIMDRVKKRLKSAVKQLLKQGRRWRRQGEIHRSSTTTQTLDRLLEDFRALGLEPGDTVVVYSSLKSLGYVENGPQTVIKALYQSVSPGGTIVFPAYLCARRHDP